MITRRTFGGGLASLFVRRDFLVLEAIAAERMPHRMVVCGVARAPFFELRDYGMDCQELYGIFSHALRLENGKFLFPFESLAARERAWREMSADPKWIAVRQNADLNEIAVYRTL